MNRRLRKAAAKFKQAPAPGLPFFLQPTLEPRQSTLAESAPVVRDPGLKAGLMLLCREVAPDLCSLPSLEETLAITGATDSEAQAGLEKARAILQQLRYQQIYEVKGLIVDYLMSHPDSCYQVKDDDSTTRRDFNGMR